MHISATWEELAVKTVSVTHYHEDLHILALYTLSQGCQTHFHQSHISLEVALKGPNVILGLYKCNYSLTLK